MSIGGPHEVLPSHAVTKVSHSPRRGPASPGAVVGGPGDLQLPADRLEPKALAVGVDEAGHFGGHGSNSRAKKPTRL